MFVMDKNTYFLTSNKQKCINFNTKTLVHELTKNRQLKLVFVYRCLSDTKKEIKMRLVPF